MPTDVNVGSNSVNLDFTVEVNKINYLESAMSGINEQLTSIMVNNSLLKTNTEANHEDINNVVTTISLISQQVKNLESEFAKFKTSSKKKAAALERRIQNLERAVYSDDDDEEDEEDGSAHSKPPEEVVIQLKYVKEENVIYPEFSSRRAS